MLLVLATHTWFKLLPGGPLGVDLFFALSGFLITTLLVSEVQRHGRIDVLRFYGRRALRLFPALALLLVAVILYFRPPPGDVLSVVFYIANWRRASGYSLGPLDPTWSLAVEEQFYLVWPVVLTALASIFAKSCAKSFAKSIALVALGGCVAALALRFVYLPDEDRIFNGTDTRLDALLVGALIAALININEDRARSALRALLPPAVVVLMAATQVATPSVPIAYSVIATCCGITVGGIALLERGMIARLLSLTALVRIGQISYGIYLWHFPLQFLNNDLGIPLKARLPFVLSTAVIAAWLSYTLVEAPVQRRWRGALLPTGDAARATSAIVT